jgi:hypothetical protein
MEWLELPKYFRILLDTVTKVEEEEEVWDWCAEILHF